jgi:hypothetical protein
VGWSKRQHTASSSVETRVVCARRKGRGWCRLHEGPRVVDTDGVGGKDLGRLWRRHVQVEGLRCCRVDVLQLHRCVFCMRLTKAGDDRGASFTEKATE